ncbi:HAMP domain-containing histidine kinase [Pseudenhygromyxa sp. WMMC2535]|uniref:HAMP domain-containing sensor histidine kinase n=1 Tax=Pseudenhygromyxa sp. WMMC2535 TaxID=2712867 RepID=UPI00155245DB|nr:HAMP domain-containing sensor histidine kinase [Pseudenhygromyxa sp. WMMC2535]NVB38661.1 HAMP domain-containing histidine kinase [Pseudenhygromyxa sp. WMMC2535]
MRRLLTRLFLINFSTFLLVSAAVLFVRWTADPGLTPLGRAREAIAMAVDAGQPPEQLQGRLELMRSRLGGHTSVYDLHGRLLASNVEPPLPPEPTSQLSRFPTYANDGTQTGWAIYGSLPDRVISETSVILALTLSVAGVLGLGLAAWATRRLVGPLLSMTEATRAIARGDFNVQLDLARSDELGSLARAFDDMTQKLARLQRSQRELLSSVSHELRTPLARMRLALTMLQDGEELGDMLPELSADVDELERMTSSVLAAAKLDLDLSRGAPIAVAARERVEVSAFVERVAARFRLAHPERELDVDLGEHPESLGALALDVAALLRACENLLDNAYRHGPADRPVRIAARRGGERGGEMIELAVIDEGPGIPAQLQELVFTPFFRVDPSRSRVTGGLGLGLAMVARIAEAHGGSVGLESTPGEGARFVIRLPAAEVSKES